MQVVINLINILSSASDEGDTSIVYKIIDQAMKVIIYVRNSKL